MMHTCLFLVAEFVLLITVWTNLAVVEVTKMADIVKVMAVVVKSTIFCRCKSNPCCETISCWAKLSCGKECSSWHL